ncbi:MAG: GTPase [Deltaproteobacteria bacterium]|nr:GTPase [Deltaproteobacteria bacterium]
MKLIFVYNADSGALNTLLHVAHKIISPATYPCNLCALTYGNFSERDAWKQFRAESPDELVFLHKDEFENQYKKEFSYPIVLADSNGELAEYLSTVVINKVTDVEDLISQLKSKRPSDK